MQTGSWPHSLARRRQQPRDTMETGAQAEAAQDSPAPVGSGRGRKTFPAVNTRMALQIASQKLGAERDRHDGTVFDRIPKLAE